MSGGNWRADEMTRCGRAGVLLVVCLWAVGSTVGASSQSLTVYLFASSTCRECSEIKARMFPPLRSRFGDSVTLRHVPVDDVEAFKLQLAYEERYGVRDDEALKVFVGERCLCGRQAVLAGLEQAIAEDLAKGNATPTPVQVRSRAGSAMKPTERDPAEARLAAQRFRSLKPAAIAVAGLIDGINPCAFTTLVFFVSLLATLKKGRRDLAVVGLCFAGAVFLTYLIMGLGAFRAVKVLSVSTGISRALTYGVAAFALILAFLSFRDFIVYRRTGRGDSITLKMPGKLRRRIRTLISRRMRTRNLIVGAVGLGVAVSLLEAVCTGQVYLPTILCVVNDPALCERAVGCLVLYNVMFIAPLLGVFALAFFGLTSERLAGISRRNTGVGKLLLGLLFLGLSVVLVL